MCTQHLIKIVVLCILPLQFAFGQLNFEITRVAGEGAGGNFLDITDESRADILSGVNNGRITYNAGQAPIEIEGIDPDSMRAGAYRLTFIDDDPTDDVLDQNTRWKLTYLEDGTEVMSDALISEENEQIIPELGLKIRIVQSIDVGDGGPDNGAIGARLKYADPNGPHWFRGIVDSVTGLSNFIKTSPGENDYPYDPTSALSTIGDGFWYPYYLCDWKTSMINDVYTYISPAYLNLSINNIVRAQTSLEDLNNVNIVFTADTSLWSRCVVIETASRLYYDQLGASTAPNPEDCEVEQFELRGNLSVGKTDLDGDGLPDPDNAIDEDGDPIVGMGWFPGYAIDLETGQRLNIFFGENSSYRCEIAEIAGHSCEGFEGGLRGNDMLWNPTDQVFSYPDEGSVNTHYSNYYGGQHFIYVTNQAYDSCNFIYQRLHCGNVSDLLKVMPLRTITWTSMPLLAPGTELLSLQEGLIPNDLTVQLRVENPYGVAVGSGEFNGHPTYEFEVDAINGIKEQRSALEQIRIAPNPIPAISASDLTVYNLPAKSIVRVFDLNGQLLSQQSVFGEGAIDIPMQIPAGLYVVQVEAGVLGQKSFKLIVTP